MKNIAAMGITAALGLAGTAVAGNVVNVDLAGLGSWGAEGDPGNDVILVDLGAGATVDSVEWTGISVFDPTPGLDASWLSDVAIGFGSTSAANLVRINDDGAELGLPNDDGGGSAIGALDGFKALGFSVDGDGLLRIELYERNGFDEDSGYDNIYESGNLAISYIPAPGAFALVGLAGLVGSRRRK